MKGDVFTDRIHIKKTAKVSVLGQSEAEVSDVWLVVHGYGQLSNYFIQSFDIPALHSSLIIAPEGLHRFYLQRFSGRVGASWMTKEERHSDIEDYLHYLDAVYDKYIEPLGAQIRIHVLGFSQGTATVCRWLAHTKQHIDNLVLWSGMMPPDLQFGCGETHWPKTYLVYDPNDPFHQSQHFEQQRKWLEQQQISYTELKTEGGHKIDARGLEALLQTLE